MIKKVYNHLRKLIKLRQLLLGLALGPILLFAVGNFSIFIRSGEFRNALYNSEILQSISSDFDSGYDLQIIQEQASSYGSPDIFVFANDKRVKDFCPNIFFTGKKHPGLLKPIIRVYEKRSDFISHILPFLSPYVRVFEFKPKIGRDDDSTDNLLIANQQIVDLDKNGTKEIIVKMMHPPCGSGAVVFNFIFELTSKGYELSATFPYISFFEEEKLGYSFEQLVKEALKNKWQPVSPFDENELYYNNKKVIIQESDTDNFSEFKDLDGDGTPEFIIGIPIWKSSEKCFENNEWSNKCERHWDPHQWHIGVYKYRNKSFNIDNNFNNSRLFLTEKKYDFYDIHGYVPLPINNYGVISAYYGLGFMGIKSEDLDFNFLERRRSMIWDIIKDHYYTDILSR